jgi:hypothetical protein
VPALNYLSCLALTACSVASADPTSGVDGALFRSSYDTGGIFSLEGARLMPTHDVAFKVLVSYGHAPLKLSVPGIGDTAKDHVLDYLVTLDMAFGMTLSDRIAIGIDVAGYRTATGTGYGTRGHFGAGQVLKPSSGLIALRPLSNIDQSANPGDSSAFLGDGLAGPLDARFGIKLALVQRPLFAVTAIGSVFLPFGDDDMLLGDRDFVFEPKLAVDWRRDRVHATRLVGNVAARIRQRTVLQSYDTAPMTATSADAKAILDVGSEFVIGAGGVYEVSPRIVAALEAQAFIPLPDALSGGDCRLYSGASCTSLQASDYFTGAGHGDFTTLVTLGGTLRVSPDVTANLMIGTGLFGARGDDIMRRFIDACGGVNVERRRVMRKVYGDSLVTKGGWVDLDRIDAEVEALLITDPAQAERFFLNRKLATEGAAFNIVGEKSRATPNASGRSIRNRANRRPSPVPRSRILPAFRGTNSSTTASPSVRCGIRSARPRFSSI